MLVAGVVLFFGSMVFDAVVLGVLTGGGGDAAELSTGQAVLRRLLVVAFVIAMTALAVRLIERRWPGELAVDGRRLGQLLGGALVGTVLISAVIGILAALGAYRVESVEWSSVLLVGLAGGLAAAVVEEVVFRGILFRVFEGLGGSVFALIASSLVFGLLHASNPDATLWTGSAIAIQAGLLLGACWMLTQNLWFAIGVHAMWNALQGALFGMNVSGSGESTGVITSTLEGPTWLVGGTGGPEESVVAVLVCVVAAAVMLTMAWRKGLVVPFRG
jgi:membrane protease YdiL (CAAX protease family)